MFHEPYFEFTWRPMRQNALALAERMMAATLLRAASRVYLSTTRGADTRRRICQLTGRRASSLCPFRPRFRAAID